MASSVTHKGFNLLGMGQEFKLHNMGKPVSQ
jgi:hypothetical protein